MLFLTRYKDYQFRKTWLMAALLLLLPSAAVRAQTSMTAFLPEIDSYFRITPNVRLVFDAKGYMEDGELNRLVNAEPERWLAMGRTDIQTGVMKIVRSIAQPAS